MSEPTRTPDEQEQPAEPKPKAARKPTKLRDLGVDRTEEYRGVGFPAARPEAPANAEAEVGDDGTGTCKGGAA